MRSCLTPIAILAAILAFALWNGSHMADSTDRWRDQLQQVDALAQAEAWTEALDALAESYEDWSERQIYLHIVAKHDSVDDAEAMYRRAAAFAESQEPNEFQAEIADLSDQLGLLAEMEQFSVQNVL